MSDSHYLEVSWKRVTYLVPKTVPRADQKVDTVGEILRYKELDEVTGEIVYSGSTERRIPITNFQKKI